jgi:1,4-alpha-glucan branching enzyme
MSAKPPEQQAAAGGVTQARASAFGELDIWLARAGRHEQLYAKLGAHRVDGGVRFAVWAPNAQYVSVIGDFNDWDATKDQLQPVDSTGIWEGIVEGATVGQHYKYHLDGREKADPVAFEAEMPPKTASVIFESEYEWHDADWIEERQRQAQLERPMTTYEVHAPSWRKGLGWRELANQLAPYIRDLGFTHVELLPVMHHPYAGSWGYQVTGFYATVSTMGSPDDFRYFVDHMHANGIGVLLDWVPAHFATDPWALTRFDGTSLYEHDDPRRGEHPDWGTYVFNLGRAEVQNFLLANALFWLREYHVDGLRVDAVASMLYLDYSRKQGEWVPNRFGGREDLEAVAFLKEFNELVHAREPGVISVAEESTAWPGVSRPTYVGGLGFGLKWNMGWMHDTLQYMQRDPMYRAHHHNDITFSFLYAFSENFMLPISHDEVVHGKGSLLHKMPGDQWQKLANVRAYLSFMWAHPGKQLLFMGSEFGQPSEWSEERGLDWWILDQPIHQGLQTLVSALNRVYSATPALWEQDNDPAGFEWIDGGNSAQNVLAFVRWSRTGTPIVGLFNFSGNPVGPYRVGLPFAGTWDEVINTDAVEFGGSGVGNYGAVQALDEPWGGRPASVELTLPPLAGLWLAPRT